MQSAREPMTRSQNTLRAASDMLSGGLRRGIGVDGAACGKVSKKSADRRGMAAGCLPLEGDSPRVGGSLAPVPAGCKSTLFSQRACGRGGPLVASGEKWGSGAIGGF